jgi:hypothetical protein
MADQFVAPLAAIAASLSDIVIQLKTIATNLANAPGGTPTDVAAAKSAAEQLAQVDTQLQAIAKQTGTPPGALPTVVSVSPTTVAVAGGTPFALVGTGLTGATDVHFASAAGGGQNFPSTGVVVVDDTHLTGVSPAVAAGLYDVFVATPVGMSAQSAADQVTAA